MIEQIPPVRRLLYLSIIALIPLGLIVLKHHATNAELSQVDLWLELVEQKAMAFDRKQSRNISVQRHFKDADHFYIDKHLEPLKLLQDEVDQLRALTEKKDIAITDSVIMRLELLTGPDNQLRFLEGSVDTFPAHQETAESLAHPVEVSPEDLRLILTRIEGVSLGGNSVPEGRPQLLISDLKLERKEVRPNADVWSLNLKLIKREFL